MSSSENHRGELSTSTTNPVCKCECKNETKRPTNAEKWYYTIITTVIFLFVTNPLTYVFVNGTVGRLIGKKISSVSGCPTMFGMILHAIVFTLVVRAVMG